MNKGLSRASTDPQPAFQAESRAQTLRSPQGRALHGPMSVTTASFRMLCWPVTHTNLNGDSCGPNLNEESVFICCQGTSTPCPPNKNWSIDFRARTALALEKQQVWDAIWPFYFQSARHVLLPMTFSNFWDACYTCILSWNGVLI